MCIAIPYLPQFNPRAEPDRRFVGISLRFRGGPYRVTIRWSNAGQPVFAAIHRGLGRHGRRGVRGEAPNFDPVAENPY
jgi:hypothetical protein